MKGSENKGFFGRLFGKKEEGKKQKTVPPPETGKAKAAKPRPSRLKSPEADKPKHREGATGKPAPTAESKSPDTSDAVELEMDIPENEFATVAISASDLILEADLNGEPSPTDAPQALAQEQAEDADVTSKVVARQYGFPEYTQEEAEVDLKKESDEQVIKDTVEIRGAALETISPRETVRIDRREVEAALKGVQGLEVQAVEEVESELVESGDEIVAEGPESPVGPVGIKDTPGSVGGTSEEAFGIGNHAKVLARFIETCQTPFNVAVHGEEGCGKTSFMRLTAFNMADSEVIPLWFNAWDYCKLGFGDHIPVVLIRRLISETAKAGGDAGAESSQRVVETIRLLKTVSGARLSRSMGGESEIKVQDMPESAASVDFAETVPLVKTVLQELVSTALKTKEKSRIVVFVDDVDRLEPLKAVELLEHVSLFLQLEGCVFVAACGLDTVVRGWETGLRAEHDGKAATSFFRKVFQLSLDLGAMQFDREGYLTELLYQANLDTDDKTVGKLLDLLETSVGFNPRVTKGIVNDFVFLAALRPETITGTDDDAEERVGRHTVLFGILCLQKAFDGVFRILRANSGNDSAFTELLEETLRSERQVLELNTTYPLFQEKGSEGDAASRVVGFVDILLDCLEAGSRHKKLGRPQKDLIKEGIELVAVTVPSCPAARDRYVGKSAVREFCTRVKGRIARLIPDLAPDASSGDLRSWPSARPWFALWYSDEGVKKAWSRGHVFFELSVKGKDWNTVGVSLKCNAAKVLELGVDKKVMEDLYILPILEEGDFEFQDHGNGWVEITQELGVAGFGIGAEIGEDDVENVVAELRDLVEATHGLFDLAAAQQEPPASRPREEKRSATRPLCKTCGTPLDRVRLKDGSLSYKCLPCGKSYKVKGVSSSAR